MNITKKHLLIMLACCLVPIIGLGVIAVFRIPTSAVVWGAMLVLCPLSHLLMMKSMGHGQPDPGRNPAKDSAHAHLEDS